MGLEGPARPRVSRETRLLLATILVSIAVLWALARLRFPDRPVATNPVPPLLTQLTEPPRYEDLASEISKLEARLLPSLVQVGSAIALRVHDNVGAVLSAPDSQGGKAVIDDSTVIVRDPATGLTLAPIPGAPAPELTPWGASQLERPRYLIASDASPAGASLRPVFVGRLYPVRSPAWPEEVWLLPARTEVAPGDFLFTANGELAGLVITHAGTLALVPGGTVLGAARGLFKIKGTPRGWLGLDVQALPSSLTSGSPPLSGVIVAWVDPEGPAAGHLAVMDVIEAAAGTSIRSPAEWRVHIARLTPGASVVLRVRRAGQTNDVTVTAAERVPSANAAILGLTMRTIRRVGAEVVDIDEGSSAARAGIEVGDVITAIGDVQAPTAQQVTRTFEAAPVEQAILVAITRGARHRVLALEKK